MAARAVTSRWRSLSRSVLSPVQISAITLAPHLSRVNRKPPPPLDEAFLPTTEIHWIFVKGASRRDDCLVQPFCHCGHPRFDHRGGQYTCDACLATVSVDSRRCRYFYLHGLFVLPSALRWVRDIRDAALANNVAFYFEGWGRAPSPIPENELDGYTYLQWPDDPDRWPRAASFGGYA